MQAEYEVEDLAKKYPHTKNFAKELDSKDEEKVKKIIYSFLANEDDIADRKSFHKILNRIKRQVKMVAKNSHVLAVYRKMVLKGEIEKDERLEYFLRVKVGKSLSGIISVTIFTSPYPQWIDENGTCIREEETLAGRIRGALPVNDIVVFC